MRMVLITFPNSLLDHEYLTRIAWISRVLPLEKFTEICRKVYFAVDQYSEVEFILANGFLYYIFAEHVAVSGNVDYGEYFCICRKNLHDGLMRLPLFLPASMEVIAALTLGVCILLSKLGPRYLIDSSIRHSMQLKAAELQWLGLWYQLPRIFARRLGITAFASREKKMGLYKLLNNVFSGLFIKLIKGFRFISVVHLTSMTLKLHYHRTQMNRGLLGLGEFKGRSMISFTAQRAYLDQTVNAVGWLKHLPESCA